MDQPTHTFVFEPDNVLNIGGVHGTVAIRRSSNFIKDRVRAEYDRRLARLCSNIFDYYIGKLGKVKAAHGVQALRLETSDLVIRLTFIYNQGVLDYHVTVSWNPGGTLPWVNLAEATPNQLAISFKDIEYATNYHTYT